MFTTCIHCTADLGRNEAIEHFPVGSRLAFDPAKGRLWVVCRKCERWNLSPLDERWEAIEEAERRYRDSRLRVTTDNIGLARLREGLDLIRIGEPQRPEMAAWRYGDQFGRRRKKQLLVTGALVGSATAIVGGIAWIGVSVGSVAGIYANRQMWDTLVHGRPSQVVARVRGANGETLVVERRQARMSVIERSDDGSPLRLRLEHTRGTTVLDGVVAERAAASILPTVNRFGGSSTSVQGAVDILDSLGSPASTLAYLHRTLGASKSDKQWARTKQGNRLPILQKIPGALHTLPVRERLAFEMALHEETERRAMNGELADLTRAWRDAELIAKIADEMFVTDSVTAQIENMRDKQR